MTWVLQLVAVDVVLLIVWTVMDRPRVVVHTVLDDGVGERPGRHKHAVFERRSLPIAHAPLAATSGYIHIA